MAGSLRTVAMGAKDVANIAIVVAAVLVILAKFLTISGSTTASNTAINSFITAIGGFADWGAIMVLIVVIVWALPGITAAFKGNK